LNAGRYHMSRFRHWRNLIWDWRLGISTCGPYEGQYGLREQDRVTAEHAEYATISFGDVFTILDFLSPGKEDVLVDVGCGKGRIVCSAARYRLREVIGFDDTPILCGMAERNLARIRGRRTLARVINCDAESFDYSLGTIYYMYYPFGDRTMQMVLDKLYESLQQRPRTVRIAYVYDPPGWYAYPHSEHVLKGRSWIRRYAHWPASLRTAVNVSFWTTA
jgi:SAM-dependent methyltransferase